MYMVWYLNTILYCIGGGKDYDSGPYIVTFPAEETKIEFNITITNDELVENKEKNFSLTINSSSLPKIVMAGNPYQAIVTVVDDDGMLFILQIHYAWMTKLCTKSIEHYI